MVPASLKGRQNLVPSGVYTLLWAPEYAMIFIDCNVSVKESIEQMGSGKESIAADIARQQNRLDRVNYNIERLKFAKMKLEADSRVFSENQSRFKNTVILASGWKGTTNCDFIRSYANRVDSVYSRVGSSVVELISDFSIKINSMQTEAEKLRRNIKTLKRKQTIGF